MPWRSPRKRSTENWTRRFRWSASPEPTAKPLRAISLDSILRAAGRTTMLAGTIEYHLGSKVLPAAEHHARIARSASDVRGTGRDDGDGGKAATMEVSSHALALGRVYGMHFHTAVFTNLTQDHLDFHHTMDDYFAAKQLLFTGYGAPPPPLCGDQSRRRVRAQAGSSNAVGDSLVRAGQRMPMVRARHIHSGFEWAAFRRLFDKVRVRDPLAADRQDQRVQHSCRLLRGHDVIRLQPETDCARHRGLRRCAGPVRAGR